MERLSFPLLSFFLLLVTSCVGSPQQDQNVNGQFGQQDQNQGNLGLQPPKNNSPATNGSVERVIMHPITDSKTGLVSQQIPLPASWKIETSMQANGPAITGPGGVKVYYRPGGSYMYSNDPYMQQSYQMAGMGMRQPVDIGTYVQQDLAPAMEKMGMRFVKQTPLPQIAAKNQAYSSQLFKAAPSQEQHASLGTDWVNAKGEPLFVIVNLMVSQGQNDVFWNANLQMIEAEQAGMEQAKAALINSIVNTQYNPQQIAAYNAAEQQKTNQSWSQHNAKMQQNQQNFQQQQALHRSTTDAVNKSMMDSYNSRMQTNDQIQHGFLNYINDENTVRDNSTGERYQVQSGADQYWMNNNQEYIPSNDVLYDPNADPNVNNQQWQQTEVEP
ncbi:MAG: hypothetical protein WAT61_05910 [Flavobacteriales bacterium]